MAKYRLLTIAELQQFEKEFVDYLVINGLTADDWEKTKSNTPEKAEKIIDLFSDVIFEGILRKVKYLDFKSNNSLKSFQCLSDKIILVSLELNDDSINLLDVKEFSQLIENPPKGIKVYTTEKKYKISREEELFNMINSGCEISDGMLFKSLCLAIV